MSRLLLLVAILGLLIVTTALADNTNPERPRGGATDGRMVAVQPYTLLRVGMSSKAVEELFATQGWIGISGNKYVLLYCLDVDRNGCEASVWVYYDIDFSVAKWKTEIRPR